jgi:diguanylate cyclase (GGDEF)-like protein
MRLHVAYRVVALALAMTTAWAARAAQGPTAAIDDPPFAHEALMLRLDDPRTGLARLQPQLDAGSDAQRRYWLHLAISELHGALEDSAASREHADRARALLAQAPFDDARHRLWQQSRDLGVSVYTLPVAEQRQAAEAFQVAVTAAGDEALRCRTNFLRAFILHAAEDNAGAWATAEDAERCAERLAEPRYLVWSLYWRATLAMRVRSPTPASVYVDRALQLLDTLPARQLRARMLHVAAEVAVNNQQPDLALRHFNDALGLFRRLGAASGAGQVLIEIARLHLAAERNTEAMDEARSAVLLLQPPQPLYRLAIAQALLVEAKSRLQHPSLSEEVSRLGQIDDHSLTRREKARVLEALAHGQASLGRHAAAYASLGRLLELRAQIDESARANQLRELAARYDTAVRDAENRELRYRADTARLELEARDQRQRTMLAALAALTLLLAAAGGYGRRLLRGRRQMAELAARDELTGSPNRRAMTAFAQQQLSLCRRMDLPLSVALIDLDHFKRVNDTFGHAVGDAVLRALARSAARALRGHDLIGRYGGEEWLVVLPGTGLDQLPVVFDRLRDAFAREPIEGLPAPHGVTFSMGASMIDAAATDETLDVLVERADRALYEAKAAGRDALRCAPAAVQNV